MTYIRMSLLAASAALTMPVQASFSFKSILSAFGIHDKNANCTANGLPCKSSDECCTSNCSSGYCQASP